MVGPFTRHRSTDAAVAALLVRCPHVDRADGAECRWTGRLERFDDHEHIFTDIQQQQEQEQQKEEQETGTDSRATKRPRSEDDDDDDDDDAVGVPPRKVKP